MESFNEGRRNITIYSKRSSKIIEKNVSRNKGPGCDMLTRKVLTKLPKMADQKLTNMFNAVAVRLEQLSNM